MEGILKIKINEKPCMLFFSSSVKALSSQVQPCPPQKDTLVWDSQRINKAGNLEMIYSKHKSV